MAKTKFERKLDQFADGLPRSTKGKGIVKGTARLGVRVVQYTTAKPVRVGVRSGKRFKTVR